MAADRAPLGLVLAGGRSRRLGGDKATADLAGRPLIAWPLDALRAVLDEVVIVAKSTTRLPDLEVPVWIEPDEPFHPAVGLVHALEHAGGRAILVCAVDLPLVDAALVERLAAEPAGTDLAVVAGASGRLQPLLARYEPRRSNRCGRRCRTGRSRRPSKVLDRAASTSPSRPSSTSTRPRTWSAPRKESPVDEEFAPFRVNLVGMPRAIWSGAISFGLVNVPVKLYSAVSKKSVRFHQLHDKTGVRIQQKRVDPSTGEEVAYEHIVKGYELSPDSYVVITPEEMESLDPAKTRSIDITDFVPLEEIDPLFFDHPYYLAPAQGGAKPYELLRRAMEDSGKVALGKVVIRSKESLVAIRPNGPVLTMETMLFADEIVSPDTLDEVPVEDSKTSQRELDMAQQLIASLSGDFEPERYHDEYRERVLEMIERKAQGEEITVAPAPEEPAKVPDLMAALEASIKAVKDRGDEPAAGDGAAKPKRKATQKRAPAKKSPTRAKAKR